MRKNFCSLRIFSIFVKTHFFTQHLIFKVFEKFMRWASKIFAWWGKISAGCKNLHPWFCSPEKPHLYFTSLPKKVQVNRVYRFFFGFKMTHGVCEFYMLLQSFFSVYPWQLHVVATCTPSVQVNSSSILHSERSEFIDIFSPWLNSVSDGNIYNKLRTGWAVTGHLTLVKISKDNRKSDLYRPHTASPPGRT